MGKIIKKNFSRYDCASLLCVCAVLVGLYLTSLHNYLLFHTLTEFFSIAVAFAIFLIALNGKKLSVDNYMLFIGLSCLFLGTFDMLHTLSYRGMGIIVNDNSDIPTQLWISARYFQATVFLVAPFLINRKFSPAVLISVLTAVSSLILFSIFSWKIFPSCFVEGVGLTDFKKTSEYIISFMFLFGIILLYLKKESFPQKVFFPIVASLVMAILSEICFTNYISSYGNINLAGHYFKIFSFAFLYIALVKSYITDPFDTMFRDLKNKQIIQDKALNAARLRTTEVSSLLDITKSMIINDDFEKTAADIISSSRKQCKALSGYIIIFDDEDSGKFSVSLCKGMRLFSSNKLLLEFLEKRYGDLKLFERSFFDNDIDEKTNLSNINNLIFSPLKTEAENYGFLVLLNKESDFDKNDLRMVRSFGELSLISFKSCKSRELFKESEERFSLFMDNLPAYAYIKNKDNKYLFANKYTREHLLKEEAVTGEMVIDGISKSEAEDILRTDEQIISQKTSMENIRTLFKGSSKERIYLSRKFPLINQSGEVMVAGIAFDITEKQKYEQSLRDEQQKLQRILSTIVHGITIVDKDYNIRYVNPAMEKEFGPVNSRKCYEYVCENERPCSWCKFEQIKEGRSVHWEYRDSRTGKIYESIEVPYIDTLDGELCKLKMLWDVTEIKQSAEKIRSLALFPSENPNPVLRISREGELLYANESSAMFLEHFGFKEKQNVPQQWLDLVVRSFEKGTTTDHDMKIDGRFFLFSITPLVSENYVNIYGRDISDYKNAEAELIRAKSELEFRVRQRTKQLQKTVELLKKEVTERLMTQDKLLHNQKRLRLLSQKLILTEERERRKFAVQLHDSVGQLLAFSKRELGVLVDSSPESQKDKIRKVWDIIKQSIDLTRKVTFDLSSPTLYTLGLKTAVEEVTEQITSEYGINCTMRDCELSDDISEDIEVFLFRSIRELLLNSAKHSKAENVYVDIYSKDNIIEVVIEDNGVGFDVEKLNSHTESIKSYGLFSIRENLDNLGGELRIKSTIDVGTEITICVPCNES
ncbi:MAG: MASE3 domain-containing protein [Sedimentisphaeraceae bacterium JB056]